MLIFRVNLVCRIYSRLSILLRELCNICFIYKLHFIVIIAKLQCCRAKAQKFKNQIKKKEA